ncbi:MAG: hypothetical protein ACKVH8_23140 [Pirellulales bacterium]
MHRISPVLAVLVCMTTVLLSNTNAAQTVIEPTGMWSGKIQDESLRKLAL